MNKATTLALILGAMTLAACGGGGSGSVTVTPVDPTPQPPVEDPQPQPPVEDPVDPPVIEDPQPEPEPVDPTDTLSGWSSWVNTGFSGNQPTGSTTREEIQYQSLGVNNPNRIEITVSIRTNTFSDTVRTEQRTRTVIVNGQPDATPPAGALIETRTLNVPNPAREESPIEVSRRTVPNPSYNDPADTAAFTAWVEGTEVPGRSTSTYGPWSGWVEVSRTVGALQDVITEERTRTVTTTTADSTRVDSRTCQVTVNGVRDAVAPTCTGDVAQTVSVPNSGSTATSTETRTRTRNEIHSVETGTLGWLQNDFTNNGVPTGVDSNLIRDAREAHADGYTGEGYSIFGTDGTEAAEIIAPDADAIDVLPRQIGRVVNYNDDFIGGVVIKQSDNDYAQFHGQAGEYEAGAGALIWDKFDNIDSSQLVSQIDSTRNVDGSLNLRSALSPTELLP